MQGSLAITSEVVYPTEGRLPAAEAYYVAGARISLLGAAASTGLRTGGTMRVEIRLHPDSGIASLSDHVFAWVPQSVRDTAVAAANDRAAALAAVMGPKLSNVIDAARPPDGGPGVTEIQELRTQLADQMVWFPDNGQAVSSPSIPDLWATAHDWKGDASGGGSQDDALLRACRSSLLSGTNAPMDIQAPSVAGNYVPAVCVRVPLSMLERGIGAALAAAGKRSPGASSICEGQSRGSTVLLLLAAPQGGGLPSDGTIRVTVPPRAPSPRMAADRPGVPGLQTGSEAAASSAGAATADDDEALDMGYGINLYGSNGAPTPEAMATSGQLHEALVERASRLYRALYVKSGVPPAMIDGVVAQASSGLRSAPVLAFIISVIPSVKQQLGN
jgi:hypothetical protein